jgi:hypothetical protein
VHKAVKKPKRVKIKEHVVEVAAVPRRVEKANAFVQTDALDDAKVQETAVGEANVMVIDENAGKDGTEVAMEVDSPQNIGVQQLAEGTGTLDT